MDPHLALRGGRESQAKPPRYFSRDDADSLNTASPPHTDDSVEIYEILLQDDAFAEME